MSDHIEYNGHVIEPTTRLSDDPHGWTTQVRITPVGRSTGVRLCRSRRVSPSEATAVARCLEFGRQIVDGARKVKIFREDVAVKAKVFTIGGFSAHADQNDLLEWVGHFESSPRVFAVHGESSATETLAARIREKFNLEVHVPNWKERLMLKPREVSFEKAVEDEPAPDVKGAMLKNLMDIETEINRLRKRIEKDTAPEELGEEDVDRLTYLKEEMESLLS